jgi:hypothetical protein
MALGAKKVRIADKYFSARTPSRKGGRLFCPSDFVIFFTNIISHLWKPSQRQFWRMEESFKIFADFRQD